MRCLYKKCDFVTSSESSYASHLSYDHHNNTIIDIREEFKTNQNSSGLIHSHDETAVDINNIFHEELNNWSLNDKVLDKEFTRGSPKRINWLLYKFIFEI